MTRATISMSTKDARELRVFLSPDRPREVSIYQVNRWLDAIDAALKPKRSAKPARKRREAKATAHREETGAIREQVMARAGGICECGCGEDATPADPLEMDHALGGSGRRRSEQSAETCWSLKASHHRAKTRNLPSAAHWLGAFVDHCERHDFVRAAELARSRLASLRIQGRVG